MRVELEAAAVARAGGAPWRDARPVVREGELGGGDDDRVGRQRAEREAKRRPPDAVVDAADPPGAPSRPGTNGQRKRKDESNEKAHLAILAANVSRVVTGTVATLQLFSAFRLRPPG